MIPTNLSRQLLLSEDLNGGMATVTLVSISFHVGDIYRFFWGALSDAQNT